MKILVVFALAAVGFAQSKSKFELPKCQIYYALPHSSTLQPGLLPPPWDVVIQGNGFCDFHQRKPEFPRAENFKVVKLDIHDNNSATAQVVLATPLVKEPKTQLDKPAKPNK